MQRMAFGGKGARSVEKELEREPTSFPGGGQDFTVWAKAECLQWLRKSANLLLNASGNVLGR